MMHLSLRKLLPLRQNRIVVIGIVVAIFLVSGLVVFLVLPEESEDSPPQFVEGEGTSSIDLGITYLPLTPSLSAYYGLGVDKGVLITEVTANTPAANAGLQAGDIILSYNGVRLEEEVPLLGMMMACPAGRQIALEVWRGNSVRVIEMVHTGR